MCRIHIFIIFMMIAILFPKNLNSEIIPVLFDSEISIGIQKSNPLTILAVGGYTAKTAGTIEVYNPLSDSWSILGRTGINVTHFSAIMLKEKLLIFGGSIDYKNTNEVWSFDLATKQTLKLAPMRKRRAFTSAAKLGNLIYVCGGTNIHDESVGIVERFNPRTNTWTFKASMPSKRKYPGMAAWKGKLYVAGGFNEVYARPKTLDIYDPKLNRWTTHKLDYFIRWIFDLIPINDYLFAIGGLKQWDSVLSDEKLNFFTNKWTNIAKPSRQLFYTSAVAYQHKIIVANSYNETYEYDSKTNRWKTLKSRILNRSYPTMLLLPRIYYKYVKVL